MSSPASILVAMLAGVYGLANIMYGMMHSKLVRLKVGVLQRVYP
jgi:hypothetical protein